MRLDAHSLSQGPSHASDYFGGAVASHNSYDDPPKTLEYLQPPNVPGVLPPIGAMLFAVIFDSDFDVLPPHVENKR